MEKGDFCSHMKDALGGKIGKCDLFLYDTADSTNTRAKLHAKESLTETPALFIAQRQTSGRGRLGRSFDSEGGGLYLSYLLYPKLLASEAVKLTVFAAVCVAQTVTELTGAEPSVKWVNDIILGGKKLAGILTEGEFMPGGEGFRYAVVGIGINLNKRSFPTELSEIATDLETECGAKVDIARFASVLLQKLLAFDVSDTGVYMEKYRALSLAPGKRVKVITPSAEYYALAQAIEDDGALRVVTDSGEVLRLSSGEISIRL